MASKKRFAKRRGGGTYMIGLESVMKAELRKEVDGLLPDLAWEAKTEIAQSKLKKKHGRVRKQPEPWEFTDENPHD